MSENKKIELRPYQFDFLYSPARHPAFVGGWGTGKTFMAINRALIYSRLIPNNLGIIFRKTATSLADSTLKDFEKYTKLKVDSHRNYTFSNGSTIMFRHIDEIGDINQQNINLGWFYIEQGEELDSDKEFFMLFGRLRRDVQPTDDFNKLLLPQRSGWVIANAGDHWMKPLWKEGKLEESKTESYQGKFSELVEANTWDNEINLPADFLDSLRVLEKTKPELYRQFVLNDWSVTPDQHALIKGQDIDALKGVVHDWLSNKRLVSCDPSQGGDECVVYAFENSKKIDEMILHVSDTMKIVGELMLFMRKHGTRWIAIDSIGIGAGCADRLEELGMKVIRIVSSEQARDKEKYFNRRSEMYGYCSEQILKREIDYFGDDVELRRQITAVRYDPKAINSQGYLKLEPKDLTKKRLGKSPDRADCFVYGIWALREVQEEESITTGFFPFEKKKAVFSGAAGY